MSYPAHRFVPVGPSTLVRWLATLPPDDLAGVLARRPETRTPPVPGNLVELADRLSLRGPVAELLGVVPEPALQVLEAWQALAVDGDVTRAALTDLLGS